MADKKKNLGPVKMEVRCCCDPSRLLGYLPVQYPLMNWVRFWVPLTGARHVEFTCDLPSAKMRYVELSLAFYAPIGETPYRCVKADGVTMELLRSIPEFVEKR